jgi:hypothetical protein
MGTISDHTNKNDAHHRDCGRDDDEVAFSHGFPHKKSTPSRSWYGRDLQRACISESGGSVIALVKFLSEAIGQESHAHVDARSHRNGRHCSW